MYQIPCENNGCYWYDFSCHSTPSDPNARVLSGSLTINGSPAPDGTYMGVMFDGMSCYADTEGGNYSIYCNVTDNNYGEFTIRVGTQWFTPTPSSVTTQPGVSTYVNNLVLDMPCDYTNETDCEANGCYWYDGSCHQVQPPTTRSFTGQLTIDGSPAPDNVEVGVINNTLGIFCYGYTFINGIYNVGCNPPDGTIMKFTVEYKGQWFTPIPSTITIQQDIYNYEIDLSLTTICKWVTDHGGASNISIAEVFEIVDSYIFNTPPPGYTFVPTITQVMGIVDYYLGFIEEGNTKTGCIPPDPNFNVIDTNISNMLVIHDSVHEYLGNLYFLAITNVSPWETRLYKWNETTETLTFTSPPLPQLLADTMNGFPDFLIINDNEGWFMYWYGNVKSFRKYNINTWALEKEIIISNEVNLNWNCKKIIKLSSGNLLGVSVHQLTYAPWGEQYVRFTLIDGTTETVINEIDGGTLPVAVPSYGHALKLKQFSDNDIYCIVDQDSTGQFTKIQLREVGGQITIVSQIDNWLWDYDDTILRPDGEDPYLYLLDHYVGYQNSIHTWYSYYPYIKACEIVLTDILDSTVQWHTVSPKLCDAFSNHFEGFTNGKFWTVFSLIEGVNFQNKLYLYIQDGTSYTEHYLLQMEVPQVPDNPGPPRHFGGAGNYIVATDSDFQTHIIKITPQ